MASFVLKREDIFPVGTSVGAYPESNWPMAQRPPSGAPVGSAASTATVQANGTVTFTGLGDGVVYYAYASVSSQHRYLGFSTPPATGENVVRGPSSSARNVIQPTDPAVTPVTARAAGGQTAPVQEWQASDGTRLAAVEANGTLGLGAGASSNTTPGDITGISRLVFGGKNALVAPRLFLVGSTAYLQGGSGGASLADISGNERIKVDGAGVAFNNVAPIAKPALPAAATDAATTQALANALRSALIAYGLAT